MAAREIFDPQDSLNKGGFRPLTLLIPNTTLTSYGIVRLRVLSRVGCRVLEVCAANPEGENEGVVSVTDSEEEPS